MESTWNTWFVCCSILTQQVTVFFRSFLLQRSLKWTQLCRQSNHSTIHDIRTHEHKIDIYYILQAKRKKFKNLKKQKSYQEYVDHKKTNEAKEHWENSTQDGILKLVVDNHEQYTEAEQKRYDGLIILLNRDSYFTHLNITDGHVTKVILPNPINN